MLDPGGIKESAIRPQQPLGMAASGMPTAIVVPAWQPAQERVKVACVSSSAHAAGAPAAPITPPATTSVAASEAALLAATGAAAFTDDAVARARCRRAPFV